MEIGLHGLPNKDDRTDNRYWRDLGVTWSKFGLGIEGNPGDPLPDMRLFLEPGAHVVLPLEATYQAAFDTLPHRWRTVLEGPRDP